MKLLLDTHALIWAIVSPQQLSAAAVQAITHPAHQVAASAVSFWEISIKAALGKLTLTGTCCEALMEAAERQGFELLPLHARLAASFSQLPAYPLHRDPFDRMLVLQAMSLGLTLVSRDRKITQAQQGRLKVLW